MSKANRRGPRFTATIAAGALALAGTTLALAGVANAAQAGVGVPAAQTSYRFETLDNAHDVTFNQLLGINNKGLIAGYFGSGAQNHPNKGYRLYAPYGQRNYVNENFPGSVQTQVTGLNDNGVTVGFWSSMNAASMSNNNFGFWEQNGKYHTADFPTGDPASPPVDQLLGVNDHDVAVGFWTDGQGNNHGYEYNIKTHRFSTVSYKGDSLTAAAINNRGDVAGVYSPTAGATDGFIKIGRTFIQLSVPGSSSTMALGVNDHDEVVGVYSVGTGSSAAMHGFTWKPGQGFTTVDDPHGIGTTTVNGVNNAGDLVGFYVDAAGNTDGFLATR
jgi:hypothetical protein